jgi:peptide/nickel transport system substrate-binding protein
VDGGVGMRSATRTLAALALTASLGLASAGCVGGDSPARGEPAGRKGVKGGTLRVVNVADVDSLDPAVASQPSSRALLRLYARTLYSWDSSATGDAIAVPVPDLAEGLPSVSDDQLTWTFRVRPGGAYAPPVNHEVTAADFVYAVRRQVQRRRPDNGYVWMIKGAREFAAGKARTIAGLATPDARTLRITLTRPAPDFLSIVSLPWLSPVPQRYAARSSVGAGYSRRVVGSGPYTLDAYVPGRSITFVRNKNWDPATDPLRKAWVDKVEVHIGMKPAALQQAIERHAADLAGDLSPPPNDELQRLATDPLLQGQLGVKTTGCSRYLVLQTDAGPTAKVQVRQAINWAVNKETVIDALGGRFAGAPATTVLTPAMIGYTRTDQYPSNRSRGDVDRARQLLREAGYPNGVTLNYVGESTGQGPAVTAALQQALARAGIKLNVKAYPGHERYTRSLLLTAKKDEHHIGYARRCPDWPGDSARSFIAALLDGRTITPTANANHGDYNDPQVNRLIDQALAEPDRERRAALWAEADRKAIADAAWAPLVYERQTFFWSYRVRNWTFSPWIVNPDYANLWLDPYTP